MKHFATVALLGSVLLASSVAVAGDEPGGQIVIGTPTVSAAPMQIVSEPALSTLPRDTVAPLAEMPRIDRRPRIGLIAGGAGLFAAAHFPTVYAAASSGNAGAWLLAIPVFGPLVAGTMAVVGGAASGGSCSIGPCGGLGGMFVMMGVVGILDGVAQAAGLAMMVAGSVPRVVRPTPARPRFDMAFVGPSGTPGLTLGITHF